MNNYVGYAIEEFIRVGQEHAVENVPVSSSPSEEPAGNIVLDLVGDEKWMIDKTYSELDTMYIKGTLNGLSWHLEDGSIIFVPLTSKGVVDSKNAFIFSTIITTEEGSSFHSFIVTENDELTYVTEEIGGGGIETAFQVVDTTPDGKPDVSEPSTQIIYLTRDPGSSAKDPYTEWIYTADGNWEVIGETSISLDDYYTSEEVDSRLSEKADKSEMSVVAGTGEDSDKTTITLKEGTSATVLTEHQDISGKVDKVEGKGLSTEDYTTAEKDKLAGIETGAQVNVLESVKVAGTAVSVSNKSVDIPLADGDTTGVVTGANVAKWNNWESGEYEVPMNIPNCLALIDGSTFDENDYLIPTYTRGELSVSKGITKADMTTATPKFPLNTEYPIVSLKMVNHSLRIDFPPQDVVSLEYYIYYKGNPQLHPQLLNNGHQITFRTESEYYFTSWSFDYYDDTGTHKSVSASNQSYNKWIHCLIEMDRTAGKFYSYINGSLVNQVSCETTGNVSIVLTSAATYWTKTPQFVHASLWNKRLSGGNASFNPEDLYREWGIYTEQP